MNTVIKDDSIVIEVGSVSKVKINSSNLHTILNHYWAIPVLIKMLTDLGVSDFSEWDAARKGRYDHPAFIEIQKEAQKEQPVSVRVRL